VLSGFNLRRRERRGLKVNRAAFFSHVKADGGQIVELNESRREHVLARVLLYVVAPTLFVHPALHRYSGAQRLGNEVQDATVLFVLNISDRQFASINYEFPGIVHLATAGGVKSRPIQHDCMLPFGLQRLKHAGFKVEEK
jgi:hypothetical protein